MSMRTLMLAALPLALAACATTGGGAKQAPASASTQKPAPAASTPSAPAAGKVSPYAPAQEDPSTRGHYTAGGLYKPGVADSTPDHLPDLDCIREPQVTAEPRSRVGNKSPYSVLGKQYRVLDRVDGYVEQGTASYYGNKFHGRRTSNQEVYDMYAYSAAHKSLPLPSFARVTNLDNGKSVVVRVNDRGPFHEGRVIEPGDNAPVQFDLQARSGQRWRVGLSVCYDLRFPELYRAHARAGADLLLVPSAFTHTTGQAHWEVLLRARAVENLAYVLAPAQGGVHANGRHTWGHSPLVAPWGTVVPGTMGPSNLVHAG